jgi:hypothetical protein
MKGSFFIPGLSPENQDAIRFYTFKSLSYQKRMAIYLSSIVLGFIIQIITFKVWPGAVFLIFAGIINLIRGYKSNIDLKAFNVESSWTQVDMEKINEVDSFNSRLSKWDKDTLDISNAKGFLMFVLSVLSLFIILAVLRWFSVSSTALAIFSTDVIILIFPLWFNGLRLIKKQDTLCIKTSMVKSMNAFFNATKKDGEIFTPYLLLNKDKSGKSIPSDCRFAISFRDMPEGFYGMQGQIHINTVEGRNYPYFYCVIAAKSGFGLKEYLNYVYSPKNVVLKYEEESAAEVIVIRQRTTRRSGYHTKINTCRTIFEIALSICRVIIKLKVS